jgi:hypothetical protein
MWRGFSPKPSSIFFYELSKRKYILLVDRKKCGEGSLRKPSSIFFYELSKRKYILLVDRKNVARVLGRTYPPKFFSAAFGGK